MVEVQYNGKRRTLACANCGNDDGFYFTCEGELFVGGLSTDLDAFAYRVKQGHKCKCSACGYQGDVLGFLAPEAHS